MSTLPPAVNNLVLRCPNWVGDIVMATPAFETLRRGFPDATITACVRPYARGILQDSPWFDNIIEIRDRSLAGMRQIHAALRRLQPDTGILLTNTTHSYLTFKIAGIPNIYGYRRNLRRHWLTGGPEPVMENGVIKPLPMQNYYLEICRYLNLELPAAPKPRLYLSEELQDRGNQLIKRYGILPEDTVFGINPGASFGSSKCWPTEYFARLTESLQQVYHCKLLLLVGPGEEEIATAITGDSRADIINTAPDRVDLALLKPLIKRCNLLVTNDTGPRHYGVAFDVPTVVVMGPTSAAYTKTNLEQTRVLQRDLPCVPCHKKVCPLGHHACMREIHPGHVMAEVFELLGDRP